MNHSVHNPEHPTDPDAQIRQKKKVQRESLEGCVNANVPLTLTPRCPPSRLHMISTSLSISASFFDLSAAFRNAALRSVARRTPGRRAVMSLLLILILNSFPELGFFKCQIPGKLKEEIKLYLLCEENGSLWSRNLSLKWLLFNLDRHHQ